MNVEWTQTPTSTDTIRVFKEGKELSVEHPLWIFAVVSSSTTKDKEGLLRDLKKSIKGGLEC